MTMITEEMIRRGAKAILVSVPEGYGMTLPEATTYAEVALSEASSLLEAKDKRIAELEGKLAEHENGDLPQVQWPASDWAIDRIAALEKALAPFADVADFMDSETEGFCMEDTLQLVIIDEAGINEPYHVNSFCLQRFYDARAFIEEQGK